MRMQGRPWILAKRTSTEECAMQHNPVLVEVCNQLYLHVYYLSLSFHNKTRTGDLVSRFISYVGCYSQKHKHRKGQNMKIGSHIAAQSRDQVAGSRLVVKR